MLSFTGSKCRSQIFVAVIALTSACSAGANSQISPNREKDELLSRVGSSLVNVLCERDSEYFKCIHISVAQCEQDLKQILPTCDAKFRARMPEIQEEQLDLYGNFGQEYGSCLIEEHLELGDFDRAEARKCYYESQ